MTIKPFQLKFSIILVLALIFQTHQPLLAQQTKTSPLNVVVKIRQLEKTLNLIDGLVESTAEKPMMSPTAFLKGMLQGTGWIDPDRLIILSVDLKDDKWTAMVLIPFRKRNDNFQAAFNATRGIDYYVLAFPAERKSVVTPDIETALADVSRIKSTSVLAIDFAVANLLKKYNNQIKKGLEQLQSTVAAKAGGTPALAPEKIKNAVMAANLIKKASQLEIVSFGFDINEKKFINRFEAKAAGGSEIAKLFVEGGKTTLMGSYLPDYMINFKSRSFNVSGLVELVNTCFGELYKEIGIDFSDIAEISKHLTGEVAGGMSFGKTGINVEMISVLKDASAAADFLESVYLPWMMKYSKKLAEVMEKQLQTEVKQIFIRTPDSTIAGSKVVGVRANFPSIPFPSTAKKMDQKDADKSGAMKYEMRMTTVGNLLLTAPDDKQMEKLIRVANALQKRPARGPLMTVEIDMAGYLGAIAEMVPDMPDGSWRMQKMGKSTCQFDLKDGRASATFTTRMDDIKAMMAHFKQMPSPGQQPDLGPKIAVKKRTEKSVPKEIPKTIPKLKKEKTETAAPKKDAAHWLNQGNFYSIYGNDKIAIKYFEKAIALDPKRSDAYFQQGVSYGELGEYQKALSSINKALELDSRKGLYYYGRGRVYLLGGDKDKAIEDFKQAASLGNRDAQNYLRNTLNMKWE